MQPLSDALKTENPEDGTAWYLVHTKPRQENTALTQLSRQGYTCYMPQMRVEKIRCRKLTLACEPLFPRYLFVRLDASGKGKSWSPIRSTLGVSHLVHFGNRPAMLPEHLVHVLRERESADTVKPLFTPGEKVVITAGPFAGIVAAYQTTNAEQRSMILLDILSRTVSMNIDTANLQKLC